MEATRGGGQVSELKKEVCRGGCVTSLASHTLRREEGSGHAATTELSPRNAIIEHCG